MRLPGFASGFIAVLVFIFVCCESPSEKEERLAKQYCSGCHVFPSPALLDKDTWRESVLPEMAFRMGFEDMQRLMKMSEDDRAVVMQALPAKPMLSEAEFESIKRYFEREAPTALDSPSPAPFEALTQFEVSAYKLPGTMMPAVTLIHFDTVRQKLFVGTRYSKLYTFSQSLKLIDSARLESPPSAMLTREDGDALLLMGIMDPNDQAMGALLDVAGGKALIASLKRPVDVQRADLNNDGLADYVICAFGNHTGALLAFENIGGGNYKKHVLIGLPGARRTVIKDIDGNGLSDITVLMTQGDEQIALLTNKGEFRFEQTTLLRFPPIYGSSYFDLKDFNQDGHLDILYTNGDNADFSPVFKPYHGVRLFLNDGENGFTESWFYAMYGASQARVVDFDQDGDMDIAAISFFPDLNGQPGRGFLYFENTGKGFTTYATPLAAAGRWLTMDEADIDKDGDSDLILGALDFEHGSTQELYERWMKEKTSLLVFRNRRY
jgi:hypothetical protein